eukprot:gene14160-biopygen135
MRSERRIYGIAVGGQLFAQHGSAQNSVVILKRLQGFEPHPRAAADGVPPGDAPRHRGGGNGEEDPVVLRRGLVNGGAGPRVLHSILEVSNCTGSQE